MPGRGAVGVSAAGAAGGATGGAAGGAALSLAGGVMGGACPGSMKTVQPRDEGAPPAAGAAGPPALPGLPAPPALGLLALPLPGLESQARGLRVHRELPGPRGLRARQPPTRP